VRAPTRALIVEDNDTWAYTFSRATGRAGIAESVGCKSLQDVEDELRVARFDIAIIDVGLDSEDDVNADGIAALKLIRQSEGDETRCVMVTGWQGGDRMDLMSFAQQKFGVDWAFMKERYDARAMIAKLTEFLEEVSSRRLFFSAPLGCLGSSMESDQFEARLLSMISPGGGAQNLHSAVSRLVSSAFPLVAMNSDFPLTVGTDGVWTGIYWSRALASAVAIGLTATDSSGDDNNGPGAHFSPYESPDVTVKLLEHVREGNIQGWLWELRGLSRDMFAG
jgi:hypothetical protein